MLGRRSNVDYLCASCSGQFEFVPLNCWCGAIENVVAHITSDVYRVFGRAKLRRIGELEIHEFIYGQAASDGRGDHVDSLINAVFTDGLSTKNRASCWIKQHLHRNALGAGVVASVVVRVRVNDLVGDIAS